jgi:hypothetical protein
MRPETGCASTKLVEGIGSHSLPKHLPVKRHASVDDFAKGIVHNAAPTDISVVDVNVDTLLLRAICCPDNGRGRGPNLKLFARIFVKNY